MFTKNSFNGKADPVADAIKAIAEADYALKVEALKGDQTKLDKNKNNKLDADDFKIIRGEKKTVKEEEKPRSAGTVFDKDVAKTFQKKEKGEGTGHEAKELKTGTQYTKKAPKEKEETNESFATFKDKLKSGAKKVLAKVGGGSDEDQLKRLQKNMGATGSQVNGKKSMAKYNEEVELDEDFDLDEIDPALVEEFMQTEEFEQLDELSKGALASYVKKASHDVAHKGAMTRQHTNDSTAAKMAGNYYGAKTSMDKADKTFGKSWKRREGMAKAVDRLAKEEVEEISELKKSTLASYVKKASTDLRDTGIDAGFSAHARYVAKSDKQYKKHGDAEKKSKDIAYKREAGIHKATDRLAKEEVEQIEELSKDTLRSYERKASTDAVDNMVKGKTFMDIADRIKARKPSAVGKDLIKRAEKEQGKAQHKVNKRVAGMVKATSRLKEEAEELSELSKETLKSYQDKAVKTPPSKNGNWVNRISGIARSAEKLKKEEVEQVEERELTPAETAEKEKNVKGMKKNIAGFRERYGSRAKEVMYATATKQAKD